MTKRRKMEKNVGVADCIARVLFAFVFILLWLTGAIGGLPGVLLVSLSTIFVITSLVRFCPLYLSLGVNTLFKRQ